LLSIHRLFERHSNPAQRESWNCGLPGQGRPSTTFAAPPRDASDSEMSDESTGDDAPEIDPAVVAFFAIGVEQVRLAKSPLELDRHRAILAERLPPTAHRPLPTGRVLDIGGGPGVYASLLASQGYRVDLVEPIPLHIEQARETARSGTHFDVHLGDARKLDFPDGVADAVLLMGPLYCFG
jgi:SAM-dependent methyltransferase